MTGDTSFGRERRALLGSVWASVLVAVIALALGIATGTRIIIFDGAFVAIGVVLSIASVRASAVARSEPDPHYPYGRESLTPLVVVIQGMAIAGTLVYAAADAVAVIREGGAEASAWLIAGYGAATAVIGFLVSWWIGRTAADSDLAAAEAAQWRAGAVLSALMLAGAGVTAVLIGSGASDAARFTDPALVLLACLVLAPIPIGLIRSGLAELLEAAPPDELSASIAEQIEQVRRRFDLPEPDLRANKIGRRLYVEADFSVDGTAWTVAEEDEVRQGVDDALAHLGLDLWATVSLTARPLS